MILCLFLVLVICGIWDFIYHKIPNICLVLGVSLFFLIRDGPADGGCGMFLLRLFLPCALGFPFYVLRMVGAGDVKLAALIFGYLGWREGGAVLFTGLLVAAALSFVKLCHRDVAAHRFSYFLAYFRHFFLTGKIIPYYLPSRDGYEPTIPFALCLSVGMVLFLFIRFAVDGGKGGILIG